MDYLKRLYHGKRVLVIGLGLQGGGVGLIQFLADLGAKITVTDLKSESDLQSSIEKLSPYNITYTLGHHDLNDFINTEVIFKGPSVPWTMPELVEAMHRGIPVEMETSFFASHCPAKIIGITGTRGKSTTTQMIYETLKANGMPVILAGNVPGVSTISLLKTVQSTDIVVLELSSWQLSGFHRKKVSPHISVFTNLYPDHLNYYKSMDDYYYDKSAIYLYQTSNDSLIANKSLKERISKDNVKSRVEYVSGEDFPEKLNYLHGQHNLDNAVLALKAAIKAGVSEKDAVAVIKNFKGVPFRQEHIRTIGSIDFINDTTSTTPVATTTAISSFSDKPIVIIFGGNSKGLPTKDVLESLQKVNRIVLLGGSLTDELEDTLRTMYKDKVSSVYLNFSEAVRDAYEAARKLDRAYVLLSPGGTSFAMFKNEFDRGEQFNSLVKTLS